MAVTVKSSGTLTADGTEQSLLSTTDSGVYVLAVDLNAMAAGDIVELRIKRKVLSGGTIRVAYFERFHDARPADDKILISVPIAAPYGADFTFKRVSGSGSSYPWSVESI
jgi:hypothetical protein